jgi:hypothetical protein
MKWKPEDVATCEAAVGGNSDQSYALGKQASPALGRGATYLAVDAASRPETSRSERPAAKQGKESCSE